MPVYRVMTIFEASNAFPADATINTLYFNDTSPINDPEQAADIAWDFYDDDVSSTALAVRDLFTEGSHSGGVTQKVYDMSDPEPRQPVHEVTRSFEPLENVTLPHEVALCLSFQGEPISGQRQARRRGRIYLGPCGQHVNANGRPSSTYIDVVVEAAARMLTASIAAGMEWSVWSRVNDGPVSVDNGWVDNAWDTQRRRGRAPQARATFARS